MKRVLIIGATSAIAIEVARRYAESGARLVLCGRHGDRISVVQSDLMARGASEVKTILGDLSDVASHQRWVDEALAAYGGLDVALLAYGVLGDGAAGATDFSVAQNVLEVNFISAVSWLTRLGEAFKHAGQGTLAAIGSVAGDRGRKSNYIYGASKGALAIYLQGLRNRLHGSGVRVVTIKPGFVDTPMTTRFKKGLLFASAESVGTSIFRSLERKGLLGALDVVYVPFFWYFIMMVIKCIPEPIFKRLSL